MRALIIGAGAIGCLVGGKLARQGHAVTLVGRPSFAAKIARTGLIMTDDDGRHVIHDLTAAGSVEQAPRRRWTS
jgi:2-dehydropantoate 2-reductase